MIYTLVRKDYSGVIDAVISFDSISSMDEDWTAKVSSQTVEKGFDISDNINVEPTSYSISATLSGYSLFNLDSEIVWDGSDFKSQGVYRTPSHIEARDALIKIFEERSILTLLESSVSSNETNLELKVGELQQGEHKETENCVITAMSISHPDSGGGAFYVTMKLQKVLVALVTTTQLAEDELSPAVVPMKETTDAVASESSTDEEDGDTMDMNGAGVLKTEEQLEADAANTLPTGVDSQASGEAQAQVKRLRFKDEISAREQAAKESAIDGYGRDVKPEGGGWVIKVRE